jgi:hypothetical protein
MSRFVGVSIVVLISGRVGALALKDLQLALQFPLASAQEKEVAKGDPPQDQVGSEKVGHFNPPVGA